MNQNCRSMLLLTFILGAPLAATPVPDPELEWGAEQAEHLLNRAGFGARPHEIERWVEAGQAALVDELLAEGESFEPFYVERINPYDKRKLKDLPEAERRLAIRRLLAQDTKQGREFLMHWVGEMLDGENPLRERMALFWHGHFTSGVREVKRSFMMVGQLEMYRANALGSYADLLRGVLKDPAMLKYLNNDTNERGKPNENLARELFELFSLGEGNYTEDDVKEAARALTGHGIRAGEYAFQARKHDFGHKEILGVKGRHDVEDLVDIILARPECSRWIAGRLIKHFEGAEPDEARLESYAELLLEQGYELRPFLRRLLLDPEFYRAEVTGARVASPIDFIVGASRRLDLDAPPAFVLQGGELLGEELFQPPNVKGWEGGLAWIDSSTLFARGNLMGILVGVVGEPEIKGRDPEAREGGGRTTAGRIIDEVLAGGERDTDLEAELEEGERGAREADRDRVDEMSMESGMMEEGMEASMDGFTPIKRKSELQKIAKNMRSKGYTPRLHLTARLLSLGAATDAEVSQALLDELLAIVPPAETLALVTGHLTAERERIGAAPGELLSAGADAEPLLRGAAHLILSLPEAQLH